MAANTGNHDDVTRNTHKVAGEALLSSKEVNESWLGVTFSDEIKVMMCLVMSLFVSLLGVADSSC